MKQLPKISIITPALNCASYIRDCIESVQQQNYPHFEHIIVDGQSTDGTVEILKNYPHLKWISEPDQGEAQALNKALRRVSGDIIGWLNADDLYAEDIFHYVARMMSHQSDFHLLYGKALMIDDEGLPTHCWVPYAPINMISLMRWYQLHLPQPSIFFSKKLIDSVGYYRDDLTYGTDYEYWLRIASQGFDFQYSNRVLSKARLFRDKGKTAAPYARKAAEWLKIVRLYLPNLTHAQQVSFWKDYYIFRYQNQNSLYKGEPLPKPDVNQPTDVAGWLIATRATRVLPLLELLSYINACPDLPEVYAALGETLRIEGHWQESAKAFNISVTKAFFKEDGELSNQSALTITNIDSVVLNWPAASSKPLKAMIFCPNNPNPPVSGASRVLFTQLRILKKLGYNIVVVGSTLSTTNWSPKNIAQLKQRFGIQVVIHQGCIADLIWKNQRGIQWPDEKWITQHAPGLQHYFQHIYRLQAPDIILINYANWGQLATGEAFSGANRIICSHDILKINKQIEATLAPHFTRPVCPNQVHEVLLDDRFKDFIDLRVDLKQEFAIYDKYDVTLTVSPIDAAFIGQHTQNTQVHYIPPVIASNTTNNNQYCAPPVFIGSNYLPNYQAYYYFVVKVLPKILSRVPDFKLRVIGRCFTNMEPVNGIEYMGYVPQLDRIYATARFAVCPLLIGTGLQIKIVEAMGYGVPVLVHANIAQQSPIQHGINGLVAHSAEEFAEYAIQLEQNPQICRRLGQAAKKTIAESFSLQKLLDQWGVVLSSFSKNQNANRPIVSSILKDNQKGATPTSQVPISITHKDRCRVTIDGVLFQLAGGHSNGYVRFWRNLIEALGTLPDIDVVVLKRRGFPTGICKKVREVEIPAYDTENIQQIAWDAQILEKIGHQLYSDIFMSTADTWCNRVRNVAIVLQLNSNMHVPDEYRKPLQEARCKTLSAADTVMTFPGILQWYIVEKLGVSHKRIFTLPLGIHKSIGIVPQEVIEQFRRDFNLINPFILLNRSSASSGISNVISHILNNISHKRAVDLLIVDDNGFPQFEEIAALFSGRVRYKPLISEMQWWAACCSALAIIDVDGEQGDVWTTLEAMACGCPAILDKAHPLNNPITGPITQIDLNHPEKIQKVLSQLIDLEKNAQYRQETLNRAAQMDWEKLVTAIHSQLSLTLHKFETTSSVNTTCVT